MITVVVVIHVIVSLGLIATVLLHAGKGGGLAGAFGGGMPSTFSGSSVMERNLDRITIVFGVTFIVTSILLAMFYK